MVETPFSFDVCLSVCASVRSRLANQTNLKRLTLQISNLTCMFYCFQRQSGHDPLKIFRKGASVKIHERLLVEAGGNSCHPTTSIRSQNSKSCFMNDKHPARRTCFWRVTRSQSSTSQGFNSSGIFIRTSIFVMNSSCCNGFTNKSLFNAAHHANQKPTFKT